MSKAGKRFLAKFGNKPTNQRVNSKTAQFKHEKNEHNGHCLKKKTVNEKEKELLYSQLLLYY